MKVLILYDNSAPKYHRLYLPIALMGVEFTMDTVVTEENSKVDIVFINRVSGRNNILELMAFRNKNGFKLIVDTDDYWGLDPGHILYQTYKETRATEVLEETLKIADYVTVTHERLRDAVLRYNPNVCVLPNSIPKEGQFLFKHIPSPFVRLLWAGGVTHQKDIEILREPVKRLGGLNIEMVMGGYSNNPVFKAMASSYTFGGKLRHTLIEALPVNHYYTNYCAGDICLIPLAAGKFNGYKSNLKILEAANMGLPVVVSHVDPYLGFPYNLVNYIEKQSSWYNYIKLLVGDKSCREEQGALLKAYCDTHYNFNKINNERLELFKHVINDK